MNNEISVVRNEVVNYLSEKGFVLANVLVSLSCQLAGNHLSHHPFSQQITHARPLNSLSFHFNLTHCHFFFISSIPVSFAS